MKWFGVQRLTSSMALPPFLLCRICRPIAFLCGWQGTDRVYEKALKRGVIRLDHEWTVLQGLRHTMSDITLCDNLSAPQSRGHSFSKYTGRLKLRLRSEAHEPVVQLWTHFGAMRQTAGRGATSRWCGTPRHPEPMLMHTGVIQPTLTPEAIDRAVHL